MKFKMLSIVLFCGFSIAKAQNLNKETAAIQAEGNMLYRSEMASWYGSDVLQSRFKNKATKASGYFSYSDGEQNKCVFFDKTENPAPLITFIFDSNYDINSVAIDTTARAFTSTESELFIIRQLALTAITTDTLFKRYNNTNLNIIPLITKESKKVFILTAPSINEVVIFGNDYLLTFNSSNHLIDTKRLHKNIIPINYSRESAETMHSHLPETGDYITSTDICTLMLYGKIAKRKSHQVVSEKYISLWDCQKQTLQLLPSATLRTVIKEKQ